MKTDLLGRLQCPYTGSAFELLGDSGATGTIEFGIVRSGAGQFPIIAGVLRLLMDDLRGPLVDLVSRGENDAALRGALEVPALMGRNAFVDRLWRDVTRRINLDPAVHTGTPGKQRLYRAITRANLAFRELADGVGAERWGNWQTLRFSMPTFLPVYPLAHMARGCRNVLDFGCGLGHSAFLMQRLAPEASIICADYSFTSMYLARRFIAPDSACICLDGNYPLPFANGYFDCVFSTDAIQYIQTKIGVAREFRRVMAGNGSIVLAHLHNRLSSVTAGTALTAEGYDGLFEGMQRRLYPEESLIDDYIAGGTLKLDRKWALPDLDRAALGGLSLVAAHSDEVFTPRSDLLDTYIEAMRHPVVNPIYDASRSEDGFTLQRRVGAPYAIERRIEDYHVLPPQAKTKLGSPDREGILALRQADRHGLRELVRRFLVLETPAQYL